MDNMFFQSRKGLTYIKDFFIISNNLRFAKLKKHFKSKKPLDHQLKSGKISAKLTQITK